MAPDYDTGWLADDLYFLAHDDVTGKPRLHPRVLGLGLAGALLAELALWRRVEFDGTDLVVVDQRAVEDPLSDAALRQILAAETPRPIGHWLALLAQDSTQRVAHRMVDGGLLTFVPARGLLRGARYAPVDMSVAAWPGARLRVLLTKAETMTLPDGVLAGLTVGCGLVQQVLWDSPASARQQLDQTLAALPATHDALIAGTERAVTNVVMNRRV